MRTSFHSSPSLLAFSFYVLFSSSVAISDGRRKKSGADSEAAIIDALMDESLRSNRVQACDGERITLQCPKNTHIQVETGFYGRVVPISQLCPERDGRPVPTLRPFYDATCDVIHAQSRVSELCDKRRKCTIFVDASTFQEDPCPATSKYLQMSYKCRPVSFDGESFCGGTEMQLECRDGRRLAIYSANYGRTPRGQPAHCAMPPKQLLTKECTRDVLGHVLSRCHAQPGCSLSISDHALGRVCPPSVPAYLSIIFMCVNEEVFSEEAIKGELKSQKQLKDLQEVLDRNRLVEGSGDVMENDEEWIQMAQDHSETKYAGNSPSSHQRDDASSSYHHDLLAPASSSKTARSSESILTPNDASFVAAEDMQRAILAPIYSEPDKEALDEENLLGIAHDIALIWQFLKQNKEKVLLCSVLSLSLALILVVLACLLQQFCPSSCGGERGSGEKEKRVRYSIETSSLVQRSNHLFDSVGGPHGSSGLGSSFVEIGDLDEPFMRFSLTSPPRSTHYDFS